MLVITEKMPSSRFRKPGVDVSGVILQMIGRQSNDRADEGGAEFGDEFFHRIAMIGEALLSEVSVEA